MTPHESGMFLRSLSGRFCWMVIWLLQTLEHFVFKNKKSTKTWDFAYTATPSG